MKNWDLIELTPRTSESIFSCTSFAAVILALCLGFTVIFIPLSLVALFRNVRKGFLRRRHRDGYVEQVVDDVVFELLLLTLNVDVQGRKCRVRLATTR